jgi:hypothetical protein
MIWSWEKKRTAEVLKNLYELGYDLSYEEFGEKVNIAYDKHRKKQKVTYDEFAMMLLTNDELFFEHNNIAYEVVHNSPIVFFCINVVYDNGKSTAERAEEYSNIVDLLQKVRIGGKAIREIWDFVTLN